MTIAQQKKQQSIIEYILYVLLSQDILRTFNFDMEKLQENFSSDEDYKKERDWYDNLRQTMIIERVEDSGNIQMLENLLMDLTKFHISLIESPLHSNYRKKFEELMPYVKELLQKSDLEKKNIIKVFIEALYGYTLLRMKGEKVSEATQEAIALIYDFLDYLNELYKKSETDNDFQL